MQNAQTGKVNDVKMSKTVFIFLPIKEL